MAKKSTPRLSLKTDKKPSKTANSEDEIRIIRELEVKTHLPLARAGASDARETLIVLLTQEGENRLRKSWGQAGQGKINGAVEFFFREIRPRAGNTKFDSWLGGVKLEGKILAQFDRAFQNAANDFHKNLSRFLDRASKSSKNLTPTKAQALALTVEIDTEVFHGNETYARMNNRPIIDKEIFENHYEDSPEEPKVFSYTKVESFSGGRLLLQLNCETAPENLHWQAVLRKFHWQHGQSLTNLLRESPSQPFSTLAEHPALLRYRHWQGLSA